MRSYPFSKHPRRLIWPTRARHKGESAFPDLWPDYAWVPSLGATGSVLKDMCGNADGSGTNIDAADWVLSEGELCIDFNGSDEYFSMGDIGVCETDEFTYFVRAKWIGTNTNRSILAEGNSTTTTPMCTIFQEGTQSRMFLRDGTGKLSNLYSISTVNDGKYHNHVVTYSLAANSQKLYVDGVEEDSASPSLSSLSGNFNTSSLGAIIRTSVEFHTTADVSLASMYKGVLTASQISQLNRDHYCWLRPKDRYPFGVVTASAYPWWYYDMLGRY